MSQTPPSNPAVPQQPPASGQNAIPTQKPPMAQVAPSKAPVPPPAVAAPTPPPAQSKPPAALPAGIPMAAKAEPPKAQEPPAEQEKPAAEDKAAKRERNLRRIWTVGSVLSIAVNIIMCLVILVLANQIFVIKKLVGNELLGGLYANFVKMDDASIKTTIKVEDTIPIQFDLPISQETEVILSADTYIQGARVNLNTGGLVIANAPANIVLPAGTRLPIVLEMTVPVQTTIPVTLNVPVDIPLNQTELHEPFTGLQGVVAPYYWMLKPEWQSCQDVPGINTLGSGCNLLFWRP